MVHKGLLIVISGPSGAGKGTIIDFMKNRNSNERFSISTTTRIPRDGEIDGKNYFFKTIPEFKKMIENNELFEWVEYCGNYYGTPKSYIEESINIGIDVILEIEVEGALKTKEKFPEAVLIFILPPSYDELKRRITNRGTENPKAIEKRLFKAKNEVLFIDKYDYIITNDLVENSVNKIDNILFAEKLKISKNVDMLNNILEQYKV